MTTMSGPSSTCHASRGRNLFSPRRSGLPGRSPDIWPSLEVDKSRPYHHAEELCPRRGRYETCVVSLIVALAGDTMPPQRRRAARAPGVPGAPPEVRSRRRGRPVHRERRVLHVQPRERLRADVRQRAGAICGETKNTGLPGIVDCSRWRPPHLDFGEKAEVRRSGRAAFVGLLGQVPGCEGIEDPPAAPTLGVAEAALRRCPRVIAIVSIRTR